MVRMILLEEEEEEEEEEGTHAASLDNHQTQVHY
jgi:hypothetical protein